MSTLTHVIVYIGRTGKMCVCRTLLRSICPPAVTYPHELFVELPNGLQSLCLDDPGLLEHLLLLLEQALDTDNKDSGFVSTLCSGYYNIIITE